MWKVCENDDASSKRWLAAGWAISAQPDKSSYANGGALCSIQLALNWATDMRGIKLYGAPFNKEGSLELNDEVVQNQKVTAIKWRINKIGQGHRENNQIYERREPGSQERKIVRLSWRCGFLCYYRIHFSQTSRYPL